MNKEAQKAVFVSEQSMSERGGCADESGFKQVEERRFKPTQLFSCSEHFAYFRL